MTNRVYLYCTNATEMPHEIGTENFFSISGKEYEAGACIPLFWLLMYEETDIKIILPDDLGADIDAHPYPYLICKKEKAIRQLTDWHSIIECTAKNSVQIALLSEWILRLESEEFNNIIIRTEELSWFSQPGELEKILRMALKHINSCKEKRELILSRRVVDLIGLWDQEEFLECESYQLAGQCNQKEGWPKPFTSPYRVSPTERPNTRKWWEFWKRT
jgi:hypothetical protein